MSADPYPGVMASIDCLRTGCADDDQPGLDDLAVPLSDDDLALRVARRFLADGIRWTPGLGWMRDSRDHWERDDILRRYDYARQVCREAAGEADDRVAVRVSSAKTVHAAVTLAQADPRIAVAASLWDPEPMEINTPSGIVDLRTGQLRPRGPEDYLTQITQVGPAAGPCPNWLRFIGEVFLHDSETLDFLQRMLGYFLTGDRKEQKLFFAWGTGANGKSTLLDVVIWLMGSYALKFPASALMQSSSDRHPTELAQLQGRRLAVSNELEDGQHWAEARIKELTGDSTLTARYMRQDFFEFQLTHKHIVAANYRPRLKGGDQAMARRMTLLPFTEVFEGQRRDSSLPEKLRSEGPQILNWMIAGAIKWARDGLAIPKGIRAASAEYLDDNDDLALWIEECCQRGGEDRASDLYASFSDWKRERGEHAPSQTAWGQRLAVRPGISRRKSNGVRYSGICLSDEERNRVRRKRQESWNAA